MQNNLIVSGLNLIRVTGRRSLNSVQGFIQISHLDLKNVTIKMLACLLCREYNVFIEMQPETILKTSITVHSIL